MKIKILRHAASDSLNSLIALLKEDGHEVTKLLLGDNSNYYGNKNHLVINWGSSYRGKVRSTVPVLNAPEAVAIAANKLHTFNKLKDSGLSGYIPSYTTNIHEASLWITRDMDKVYCRTLLTSSQGNGIVIASTIDELVPCDLYVRDVPIDREIRVHVFDGGVIDFSQKRKIRKELRKEKDITLNSSIRNLKGGWIFARNGVEIPDKAKEISIEAIRAIGLDFGAIDIVLSNNNQLKILEINTAPGMEGTTLEVYFNAIREYISNKV